VPNKEWAPATVPFGPPLCDEEVTALHRPPDRPARVAAFDSGLNSILGFLDFIRVNVESGIVIMQFTFEVGVVASLLLL